ncbi:AbrB/MazE/SpoVT family DNA-binding domain-containing protein [bacterium]|nr:AbrB/MazE/SpoVT family DNA-binding domain-containing protein [bacterium]MBU1600277.1 AbrB/MazE/SpoVT family DNA-binding domain-containing protein [bacterium]
MIAIAHVSSKGQVTIPIKVRKVLRIKGKGEVRFEEIPQGILIKYLELKEDDLFSEDEWRGLESLANKKGKRYSNADGFLKSLEGL